MKIEMNEQITQYINAANNEQKEIMTSVRSILHQHVKDVKEEFKWSRPVFKTTDIFAYLQSNKNHVNLGFYKDLDKLEDPNGLLEGTGKNMRHIKLKSVSDIDPELLRQWFLVLTKI